MVAPAIGRTLQIVLTAKNLTGKALNKIRKHLGFIQKGASKAFSVMTSAAASATVQVLALVAAIGGFRAVVTWPAEFNKQLQLTGTLGAEARARLGEFKVGIIALAAETGVPLQELNKGLFDTISAGVNAGEAIGILEESARLAVGGGADLTSVVKGLATVTNAYGVTGKAAFREISNELFAAQVIGKTTIGDLSDNIGKLAAVSKEAGIDYRELFTAFADSANVLNNTEEAAVSLRQTIVSITKPNEKLVRVMEAAGVPLRNAAFRWGNLGKILSTVKKTGEEMGIPMTALIGNVRAIGSASVLSQDEGQRFNKMLERQATLAGELSLAYENMQKELSTTLARAKELAKGLAIPFSEGVLKGLNERLREALDVNVEELMIKAEIAGLKIASAFQRALPVIYSLGAAIGWVGIQLVKLFQNMSPMVEKTVGAIVSMMEGVRRAGFLKEDDLVADFNKKLRAHIKKHSDFINSTASIEHRRQSAYYKEMKAELDEIIKRRKELISLGAKELNQVIAAVAASQGGLRVGIDTTPLFSARKAVDDALANEGLFKALSLEGVLSPIGVAISMLENFKTAFADTKPDIQAVEDVITSLSKQLQLLAEQGVNTPFVQEITAEIERLEASLKDLKAESKEVGPVLVGAFRELHWLSIDELISERNKRLAEKDNRSRLDRFKDMFGDMGGFGDLLASFANGFAKAGEASRAFNLEMQSLGETLRGTLETGVAAALDGWAKGTKTASEAFSSMINSMITEINKMMSRRVVHAFLDMLFGGGWSLGPRLGNGQADMGIGVLDDGTEFAHGGIVNAPTRALIGEAGPEAVVPLSRGRAIPVEIKDLAGGRDDSRDIGVTINISAVDGASVQRMLLSDDGKRAIQTALRDARSTRRDLRW